jgi:hypothetical protein
VFIHITDDLTGDGLPDLLSEGGGGDRIYTGDLSGTLDSGVDGRPIYDRSGYIHLGGLDMDSDGLPDYRVRCYDEYRRALWGHVDIDEDECTPFGEFQPTSVLRDIDGDGGQELSDGQYIQEVASFVDDGRYDYVHYSQGTYADIDGDGRTDVLYVYTPELGHPTHRVVLDVLAGDATQVVVDSTIRALFEDFSGDGLPELLFEVDVGTLMVIGQ